jgi:hypothetical protein
MRDTAVIGAAGEHLVLSRLLSQGILAAKAPDGTSTVDLVVHQAGNDGSLSIAVALQVKTRTRGGDGGWHMGQKHEDRVEPWLYYCFVDFEPEFPIVFVIPSAKVAEVVRDSHATWLAIPGKQGQPHQDSKMRRIMPKWSFGVASAPDGWMDEYREAWSLLGLERNHDGAPVEETEHESRAWRPESILSVFGKEAVLSVVPRHFERWTEDEEARLVTAYTRSDLIGMIADAHLRTPTAIVYKLRGMGHRLPKEVREEAAQAQRHIWAKLAEAVSEI